MPVTKVIHFSSPFSDSSCRKFQKGTKHSRQAKRNAFSTPEAGLILLFKAGETWITSIFHPFIPQDRGCWNIRKPHWGPIKDSFIRNSRSCSGPEKITHILQMIPARVKRSTYSLRRYSSCALIRQIIANYFYFGVKRRR